MFHQKSFRGCHALFIVKTVTIELFPRSIVIKILKSVDVDHRKQKKKENSDVWKEYGKSKAKPRDQAS